MPVYDIFNGDADGLCALQQLRLVQPRPSLLVTGPKRDIALLGQIQAAPDDEITVLDLALPPNRDALLTCLARGASCLYVDHHGCGERPSHPRLRLHIDTRADTCTALLVDALVGGVARAWAVVAAFGDGLPGPAEAAAAPLGLSPEALARLRILGEALNYNAYGEQVQDLAFHPAELHHRLLRHADPLEFLRHDEAAGALGELLERDVARAQQCMPQLLTGRHRLLILPAQPWSRRASGVLAHRLAQAAPAQAQAVLTPCSGGYVVSVRAPVDTPRGAGTLCQRFGGGGREQAGGIARLHEAALPAFRDAFVRSFPAADDPTLP